jgi:enolase
MSAISEITALEILDSRGNPTLRARVRLDDGAVGIASVPSGASTGENEACERRDGDAARYGGKGVREAVRAVSDIIAPALRGTDPFVQPTVDAALIALDGTPDKSRLGANAILGVSMAVARAAAASCHRPLYAYLGGANACRLPVPMMNVINGGAHADSSLDFQEFMIVPHGAPNFAEALRFGAETFHALRALLKRRGFTTSVGDEGGFAPNLPGHEAALDLIVEAIRAVGLRPGPDVAIALDPAASGFAVADGYELRRSGGGHKTSDEMTAMYARWLDAYPVVSLEDGLGEHDWDGFRRHTAALGGRIQIVGDDNYVTNPKFIARGIAEHTTNAALIKLNQIGTVTETTTAVRMCQEAGWRTVVSHRSGETEDTFIADFAVAVGSGQIKTGSLCRGERIAKYNRLLEIEQELGSAATFTSPFVATSRPM